MQTKTEGLELHCCPAPPRTAALVIMGLDPPQLERLSVGSVREAFDRAALPATTCTPRQLLAALVELSSPPGVTRHHFYYNKLIQYIIIVHDIMKPTTGYNIRDLSNV